MSAQSSQLINGFVINYTKVITIFVFVAQDGTRCHIRSVNHARTDGDVTSRGEARGGGARQGEVRRGNKSCWLADTFVSFSCSSAQVLPAVNCLISFLWNAALSLSLSLSLLYSLCLCLFAHPRCVVTLLLPLPVVVFGYLWLPRVIFIMLRLTLSLWLHTPAVPRPALHRTAPPLGTVYLLSRIM